MKRTVLYTRGKGTKKQERYQFRIVEKASRSRTLELFKQLLFRRSGKDGLSLFLFLFFYSVRFADDGT